MISIPIQFELFERPRNGAKETYRLQFPENAGDHVALLRSALLVNSQKLLDGIKHNIKWQASIRVVFSKAINPNIITDLPVFFLTEPVTSTSGYPLDLHRRMWHQIDTYEKNIYRWVIDHLINLDVHVYVYDPLRADGYIALSKSHIDNSK